MWVEGCGGAEEGGWEPWHFWWDYGSRVWRGLRIWREGVRVLAWRSGGAKGTWN